MANVLIIPARREEPVCRDQSYEGAELVFDRVQILVYIRMVEFAGCDDPRMRAVVEHLRGLLEVSGVVLVSFDNKVATLSEAIIRSKVPRQATDHEAWVQALMVENPRDHGAHCGLAVGTCDNDPYLVTRKIMRERRRH